MNWLIEFYTLPNGECPLEEFLDSLSKEVRAKALSIIDILQTKGTLLREPHTKKIHGVEKLFELRFRSSGNSYRIFYFPTTDRKFILLHGFIKKSEETPIQEIQRAIKFMNNYLLRKNKSNGSQKN